MNQSQRTFLIKKIEETSKMRIKVLEESLPERPNLENYLLHAVMSGNFQLRTIDEIKETLRQKALKGSERDNWLGNSWGSGNKTDVHFKPREIFIIPDEYEKLLKEYKERDSEVRERINKIKIEVDTLITRIQLASDKTLQTMINEVDDMGNISLMDTKLKQLTA